MASSRPATPSTSTTSSDMAHASISINQGSAHTLESREAHESRARPVAIKILITGFTFILAVASSVSSAMFAFLRPTGTEPKDFNWSAFFKTHPFDAKFFASFWNAFSSLFVNIVLNMDYYPRLAQSLKKLWTNVTTTRDAKSLAGYALLFFLGTAAAISASAIGHDSFMWAGVAAASAVASVTFLTTLATRAVGTKALSDRMQDAIEEHHDEIKHGKKSVLTYLKQLERRQDPRLSEIDRIMEGRDLHNDFHMILSDISLLFYEDTMITRSRKLQNGAAFLFDKTLSTTIGAAALLYFIQKGVDGTSVVSEKVKELNPLQQVGIGFFPGIASVFLYVIKTNDFRPLLMNALCDLSVAVKHQQWSKALTMIAGLGFAFAVNYSASTSMEGVGISIDKNPTRIFEFLSFGGIAGDVAEELFRLGAFIVNASSTLVFSSAMINKVFSEQPSEAADRRQALIAQIDAASVDDRDAQADVFRLFKPLQFKRSYQRLSPPVTVEERTPYDPILPSATI